MTREALDKALAIRSKIGEAESIIHHLDSAIEQAVRRGAMAAIENVHWRRDAILDGIKRAFEAQVFPDDLAEMIRDLIQEDIRGRIEKLNQEIEKL